MTRSINYVSCLLISFKKFYGLIHFCCCWIDDRGDGVYILLIFNVTEEDNSKYMCILVNNEERVISEAELYVVPKGCYYYY